MHLFGWVGSSPFSASASFLLPASSISDRCNQTFLICVSNIKVWIKVFILQARPKAWRSLSARLPISSRVYQVETDNICCCCKNNYKVLKVSAAGCCLPGPASRPSRDTCFLCLQQVAVQCLVGVEDKKGLELIEDGMVGSPFYPHSMWRLDGWMRQNVQNVLSILFLQPKVAGPSKAMGRTPTAVRSRKQRQAGASFQSLSW